MLMDWSLIVINKYNPVIRHKSGMHRMKKMENSRAIVKQGIRKSGT